MDHHFFPWLCERAFMPPKAKALPKVKSPVSGASPVSSPSGKASPTKETKGGTASVSKGKGGKGGGTSLPPISPKGGGSASTKSLPVSSSPSSKSQKEKDETESPPGNGEIHVKYNHYNKPFIIKGGELPLSVVDEEYSLTYAFPKCKLHMCLWGPNDFSYEEKGFAERPLLAEGAGGVVQGLEVGTQYYIIVEEDAEEIIKYEARAAEAAVINAAKRAAAEEKAKNPALNKSRGEGCSCLYGNPCMDQVISSPTFFSKYFQFIHKQSVN
jgi:hypothetical protein